MAEVVNVDATPEDEKYPWDEEQEEEKQELTTGAKVLNWCKCHKKLIGFTVLTAAGVIFLYKIIKSTPDPADEAYEALTDNLNDPYDPFKDAKNIKDVAPVSAPVYSPAPDTSDISKKLEALEKKLDAMKSASSAVQAQTIPVDLKTFYRRKYPNIPEYSRMINHLSNAYWVSDNILNVACNEDMSASSDIAMAVAADMMNEVLKSGVDLADIDFVQLMVDLKEK